MMRILAALMVCALELGATLVPRLSFEQLVERSEAIVEGVVLRSWAEWDAERSSIWTHYRIRVSASLKGAPLETIVISEPGGEIDGVAVEVVGAPRYAIGESVVVFADRTEIGYLRTCGWGQGKYRLVAATDAPSGRKALRSLGAVELAGPADGAPGRTVDGMDLEQFRREIREAVGGSAGGRD